MQLKLSTVFWIFVWCIFMGITVGSIGIGALFPSANLIAKPFVCPGGQMQVISQDYHPSPVETVTTLTWYCVDHKTGTQTEVGLFPMSLYAGTIYGLLLFLVVLLGMVLRANRRSTQTSKYQAPIVPANDAMMENLRLREAAQLNQQKYEDLQKKMEKMQSELDKKKNNA